MDARAAWPGGRDLRLTEAPAPAGGLDAGGGGAAGGWAVAADGRIVEVDAAVTERAGRAELRREIAHLERALARWGETGPAMARLGVRIGDPPGDGPSLLGTGQLVAVRDELARRLGERREAQVAELARRAAVRRRLEQMWIDPDRHHGAVIDHDDLGATECVEYRVVPRAGVLGRLLGWWRDKVSSGCPRAAAG